MAGIPSSPPLAPARRRAPERVSSSDGPWCCSVSTAIPATPLADELAKKTQSHELPQAQLRRPRGSRHRQNRGDGKSGNNRRTGRKNSTSGGGEEEIIDKKSENSGDFVAKTGVEVTALIKQGFLEGGGSPFRIRVSPGRVSPIYESPSLTLVTTDSGAKNNALLRHSSSTTSCNNNNNNNNSSNNNNNNNNINNNSIDKTRSSPTLFEMMVNEHSSYNPNPNPGSNGAPSLSSPASAPLSSYPTKRHFLSVEEKLERILVSACSPGNQFNDSGSGDVRLTLSNKDGISVTLSLHRHVLASHSRIFASKLEEWPSGPLPCLIEISDCDDVEIYLQTLRLMYCRDLKRRLMNETVSRVLGILTVSAAIVFEAGIRSCLEYLEAMPWPEEDEERVCLLLSQLELGSMGGCGEEVLKRLWSQEDPLRGEGGSGSEAVLVELLHSITATRGTDEKARREMKAMVARMLRENNNNYNYSRSQSLVDIRKESLYNSCQGCIDALLDLFKQASCPEFASSDERISIAKQISRQADNLNWLVDILVDREIAGDLIHTWGCQTEMAALHCHVLVMYRFEISYVTARLCLAIAKGQVVISAGERFRLLDVWLKPLMDDFTWMQRCGNKDGVGLERKLIEEGISQTILTLPLMQQQAILLSWFNCFLSRGADDCPNLHHAFEVWWRRSFVRRPPHRLLSLPPIDTPLLPPSS